ncbi:hypothetical protein SmJEL517_g03896 [Synchytrium microbalum]|uniref:Cytochrome P450 n=1 Tax=Synchytrium microbalum TaxID=1806994 RepID=A0A507C6P0_9FUNG|nr:uncharacterized protein SmJEL517_g03896 [Synchytrium microbalum]TPX33213.1 hypothetical protein SmJEL517_g03896 [Synchytrium microbalum]
MSIVEASKSVGDIIYCCNESVISNNEKPMTVSEILSIVEFLAYYLSVWQNHVPPSSFGCTVITVGAVTLAAYVLFPQSKRIGGVPVFNALSRGTYDPTKEPPFVTNFRRYLKMGRIYGSYVLNPFRVVNLSIAHPKILREMLQSNYHVFDRGHPIFKIWYDVAGGLVYQSNGKEWSEARALFQPFFTMSHMRLVNPLLEENFAMLMHKFEEANIKHPEGFDAQEYFLMATFDNISQLTFGASTKTLENEGSAYLSAFEFIMVDAMRMFINQFRLFYPSSWNAPSKKYTDAVALIRSLCYDKIDEFAAKGELEGFQQSILGTILKKGAIPAWMDREHMTTHLVTLLFAGHDTTSNLLTFAIHFAATYPEYQEMIRQEAITTFGKDGPITVDKLESLKFVNAFIKETLRLRPSGPELGRVTNDNVHLEWEENGEKLTVDLPPRSIVSYSIYAASHHPLHYPDRPEEFDPRRFLDDPIGGGTSVYAFIPFSYGPRRCLGERLALMEARWILCDVMRRWKVVPAANWTVKMEQAGNMRANAVKIQLHPL